MKQVKKKKSSKVPEEKVKQLDLGIKEPFKNKFFKIKNKTDIALLQIEVKKFLRDPFFWFATIFSAGMLLQQCYIIYNTYNIIPKSLPVLTYNLATNGMLADKHFILIYPIITLFCFLLGIIITSKYYNREKVLSKFILLCTLLTAVASTILLVYLTQNY